MTQAASGDVVIEEVDPNAQDGAEQQSGQTTETVEGAEGEQGASAAEGSDDEVIVSIGEVSPTSEEEESRAPEWVRELRKSNREKDRKLREQEAEITRLKGTGTAPAVVTVGEKPTLEGCNYDAAKFEADLDSWKERKHQSETQQAQKDAEQRKQNDAWQTTLQTYGEEKSALKVKDYDEAEDVVRDTLSVVQQGVILDGVPKGRRAVVIYALGKNPSKLKELAAIESPVKFMYAVAQLESQLKVTPRKSVPAPERVVRSSVAGAAAVDNQLEKLREEAAKTGDLSKVLAFKNQKRAAGK